MKNQLLLILGVLPFILLLMFGENGAKMVFWGYICYRICSWWNPFEIQINKVRN